jgi:hypothetical protein
MLFIGTRGASSRSRSASRCRSAAAGERAHRIARFDRFFLPVRFGLVLFVFGPFAFTDRSGGSAALCLTFALGFGAGRWLPSAGGSEGYSRGTRRGTRPGQFGGTIGTGPAARSSVLNNYLSPWWAGQVNVPFALWFGAPLSVPFSVPSAVPYTIAQRPSCRHGRTRRGRNTQMHTHTYTHTHTQTHTQPYTHTQTHTHKHTHTHTHAHTNTHTQTRVRSERFQCKS